MHVVQHPVRGRRRMYSPIDRGVVSGEGLGEVGNILKNISRIVGGAALTIGTGGLIWAAPKKIRKSAELITGSMVVGGGIIPSIAPKAFGLNTSQANWVRGLTAAGAAAVGGVVAGPAVLAKVGSGIGTTLKTVASVLPAAGQVMGGGGGGSQVVVQQDPYAQQYAQQMQYQQEQALLAEQNRQQQLLYEQYVQEQNARLYGGAIPAAYAGQSYGDLRSPYVGVNEDGEQVQFDAATGNIIPAGMSTGTVVAIGVVIFVGGLALMLSGKSSDS